MSVKFNRTEPRSVMRQSSKIVRPLITGTPKTIQFMESRIDKVGDYFIYYAEQAAEELTEHLRASAQSKPAWSQYADLIRIEFDPDQFQFVLRADGSATDAVRELELTADTIFTAIAGDHLTDLDNSHIVGEIKSGPVSNVSRKVNNTVKKALFLGSSSSGQVYDG